MKLTNEMIVLFPELIEIIPFGYREFCLEQSNYQYVKECYDIMHFPSVPVSDFEIRKRESSLDDWLLFKDCVVYDTRDLDSLVYAFVQR